jgi:hypothetical protein
MNEQPSGSARDPEVTDAVVRADINGDPRDLKTTVRPTPSARQAGRAGRRPRPLVLTARQAAGAGRSAEGQIGRRRSRRTSRSRAYTLTAGEITGKLPDLPEIDLAKIEAYEARTRTAPILSRVTSLRATGRGRAMTSSPPPR